jgi:hypothetical protein
MHQIQGRTSTLVRNNITVCDSFIHIHIYIYIYLHYIFQDVFLFQQTEKNGIDLMYETFGSPSKNVNQKHAFKKMISELPQHHFAHYNRIERVWTTHTLPHPLPNFRIYLHKEDAEAVDEGMQVIFGNKENYSLKVLETEVGEIEQEEELVDTGPLFENGSKGSDEDDDGEEPVQTENEYADPDDDVLRLIGADLKGDKNNNKKRKTTDEKSVVVSKKKQKKEESLLTKIGLEAEETPEESDLSLEDKIINYRMRGIFRYVKYQDNPDKDMLNQADPDFLKQDFQTMPYEELKGQFRSFDSMKSLHGLLQGVHNKYSALELISTAAVSKAFGDDPAIPLLVHSYFRDSKHGEIMNALAKSNPYSRSAEPDLLTRLVNNIFPIGMTVYSLYTAKAMKIQLDEQLSKPFSEDEANLYNDMVVKPF